MTRQELHHILETRYFDERRKKGLPIFEWEHCAKSFQHISNDLAMEHLMGVYDSYTEDEIILKCEYNSDVYYFGVGLKDCENISLKRLKKLYQHGNWSVYTWCD